MTGRAQSSDARPEASSPAQPVDKKAYASPRLVRYGSVESLTRGAVSHSNDNQATKTGPQPG